MAMTKADFQEIAGAVREARDSVDRNFREGTASWASATAALDAASERLASACARRYKGGYGFNRSRFLEACGVEDTPMPSVRVLNDNEPDRLGFRS